MKERLPVGRGDDDLNYFNETAWQIIDQLFVPEERQTPFIELGVDRGRFLNLAPERWSGDIHGWDNYAEMTPEQAEKCVEIDIDPRIKMHIEDIETSSELLAMKGQSMFIHCDYTGFYNKAKRSFDLCLDLIHEDGVICYDNMGFLWIGNLSVLIEYTIENKVYPFAVWTHASGGKVFMTKSADKSQYYKDLLMSQEIELAGWKTQRFLYDDIVHYRHLYKGQKDRIDAVRKTRAAYSWSRMNQNR